VAEVLEFEQIRLEPAYRKVADALIGRIVDRTLRDGDRLPGEVELARQFGVNRSTVREAMRELESGGLLARRRGSKRMVVTRPGRALVADGVSRALVLHDVSFIHVWEALNVLEPPIAAAAAARRTLVDLEELKAIARDFALDNARATHAIAQVAAFFRSVGDATHNPALIIAQEPLIQLLAPSLEVMIDQVPQARTRIATAQRRLCEAIAARDVETARSWMAKHIRDFRRGYELAGIDMLRRVVPARGDG
jgi:GntR family transcriptional repressor for pyruvate dehydrogenase complex